MDFGFQMRGDAPVIVSYVEMNSLADVRIIEIILKYNFLKEKSFQLGGIKEGDFIVEFSGIDVKWFTHRQVSKLIQSSGSSLDLKVITPMDRNYLKV